ncbi:hypothetical protein P691DRAFT_843138 [Macrolepiota fuliginosa MF-IS2]|uniref:Uncharacterized protein n=1 Tax=Macrolepiota fuliginosa MF-IS2 TaxID=1400762 RepID=A0A9P6BZE7_9AGAR|nr:hypothetical protein P691DRAFT_843138 [Macrolepiota fuliginosa MF-IS2]
MSRLFFKIYSRNSTYENGSSIEKTTDNHRDRFFTSPCLPDMEVVHSWIDRKLDVVYLSLGDGETPTIFSMHLSTSPHHSSSAGRSGLCHYASSPPGRSKLKRMLYDTFSGRTNTQKDDMGVPRLRHHVDNQFKTALGERQARLGYVVDPAGFWLKAPPLNALLSIISAIHKDGPLQINKTMFSNFSVDLNNPSKYLLSIGAITAGIKNQGPPLPYLHLQNQLTHSARTVTSQLEQIPYLPLHTLQTITDPSNVPHLPRRPTIPPLPHSSPFLPNIHTLVRILGNAKSGVLLALKPDIKEKTDCWFGWKRTRKLCYSPVHLVLTLGPGVREKIVSTTERLDRSEEGTGRVRHEICEDLRQRVHIHQYDTNPSSAQLIISFGHYLRHWHPAHV